MTLGFVVAKLRCCKLCAVFSGHPVLVFTLRSAVVLMMYQYGDKSDVKIHINGCASVIFN